MTSVTLKIKFTSAKQLSFLRGLWVYTKFQIDSCKTFWVVTWIRVSSDSRQTGGRMDRQTDGQHDNTICPSSVGHIKLISQSSWNVNHCSITADCWNFNWSAHMLWQSSVSTCYQLAFHSFNMLSAGIPKFTCSPHSSIYQPKWDLQPVFVIFLHYTFGLVPTQLVLISLVSISGSNIPPPMATTPTKAEAGIEGLHLLMATITSSFQYLT